MPTWTNLRWLVVGLLGSIWACDCSSGNQETAIRQRIDHAIGLAEKQDAAGLLEMTTSDFRLIPGGADRRRLQLYARQGLGRLRKGRVLHPRPGVELGPNGDTAQASFAFLVVRGDPPEEIAGVMEEDNWLEAVADKTRVMRVSLDLRLEDDEWKFSSARLERFDGLGFRPVRAY